MIPPDQEFQHDPINEISLETMILTTWAHSQLMPQEAYDEIQELSQILSFW